MTMPKPKPERRAEAEGQTEWTETERETQRKRGRETGRQAIPASKKLRQKKLIYLMSRGRAKAAAAAAEEKGSREGEVESLLFPVAAGPFNVAGDMSKVFLLLSVGVAVIVVVMFVI